MTRYLSTPRYDSIELYSLNGELLSYIDKRKLSFYMRNRLVVNIGENKYKLNFLNKGENKYDLFTKNRIENICVCCGASEQLQKHHVVPNEYRKNLPLELKEYLSHDILLMCVKCHHEYGRKADILKEFISEKYAVPSIGNALENKAAAYAEIILRSNKLHPKEYEHMSSFLRKYLRKNIITDSDLVSLNKIKNEHGKELLEKVTDKKEFVRMWRNHFYHIAKPKYLPKYWNINYKL